MTDFSVFRDAVNQQLDLMVATGVELFEVGLGKNDLWETYLASFPEGTDPVFRERSEHDCQCCKQFIRNIGKVVTGNAAMMSVWDISIGDDTYQPVADALSALVKQSSISNIYRHYEKDIGTAKNNSVEADGSVATWEHFHYVIPNNFVMRNDQIATALGKTRTNYEVLKRSLTEITLESVELVLELIAQNSLYRGSEHKAVVELLKKSKKAYDKATTEKAKELFLWGKAGELKEAGRFKNTVIGTLLVDLSSGVDLTKAVKSFEAKVAPANYKRPTALITQSMIKKSQETVEKLGLEPSLHRRYAVTEDLTINNVLFADRSAKTLMEGSVFDGLAPTKAIKPNLDNVTEVTIEDFITNVLPSAEGLELMVENKHVGNLVSLIAPVEADATNILKWDNNFSWSYNGEVTDSMKERVKSAGGSVTGVLRYSIQWNEENKDPHIDLDAHCIEPDGNKIFYGNSGTKHRSSGILDVDIQNPGKNIAVENITWSVEGKMQQGDYTFIVHNFSSKLTTAGFSAEIEYDGVTHSFAYPTPLRGGQKITVAAATYGRDTGLVLNKSLPTEAATKNVWGVDTHTFHKVDMVMLSPNHWDDQDIGNKHWFFMIDKCKNPDSARGFYNEFLRGDLTEHRKVFEVLSGKLKTPEADNQLSGLGFSSTQKSSVLCKVSGTFNRIVKINF
jgi:hypothetical protein